MTHTSKQLIETLNKAVAEIRRQDSEISALTKNANNSADLVQYYKRSAEIATGKFLRYQQKYDESQQWLENERVKVAAFIEKEEALEQMVDGCRRDTEVARHRAQEHLVNLADCRQQLEDERAENSRVIQTQRAEIDELRERSRRREVETTEKFANTKQINPDTLEPHAVVLRDDLDMSLEQAGAKHRMKLTFTGSSRDIMQLATFRHILHVSTNSLLSEIAKIFHSWLEYPEQSYFPVPDKNTVRNWVGALQSAALFDRLLMADNMLVPASEFKALMAEIDMTKTAFSSDTDIRWTRIFVKYSELESKVKVNTPIGR